MIKVTSTVTGLSGALRSLDAIARMFEDTQQFNRDAAEALEPTKAVAHATIHKKSGRTAAQIEIWQDDHAPAGQFRVFMGVRGNRSFVAMVLEGEFGGSRRKAFPWLRPANAAEGGERLMRRFADIVRRRVQSLGR